jgi:hypothetical protein
MHDFFFEKLRNAAHSRRAGLMRQFRTGQVYSNRFGYRIFRDFAANYSRFARILISRYWHFAANEWIRRPDIRIFRDFATGAGTWYWYSCDPDPYGCIRYTGIRILVDTDFISGYLSDIWGKNIGYFQP